MSDSVITPAAVFALAVNLSEDEWSSCSSVTPADGLLGLDFCSVVFNLLQKVICTDPV